MANIEFTKDALREAITKRYDEKIERLDRVVVDASDPSVQQAKREQWRGRCAALIRGVMAQINDAENHDTQVEDGVFLDFDLPPYPAKADSYDVRSANREVESAKAARERYLNRVEAMSGDTIALTPKQLSDYFGI